ncbi:MAG: substrate-binding domain-containing protein [Sedimentisphaerales bacterium]
MKEKTKIAFAYSNITHNTEGLMAGITDYIRDKGHWQLIVWPESSKESLLFLKQRGCKGAFVSTQTTTKAKELLQIDIPIIALSTLQNVSDLPYITANSESVAGMAGEYFLKKKFKNFAFFGLTQAKWSLDRMEFFSRYLAEEGYEVRKYEEQIPIISDFVPFTTQWINITLNTGQQKLIEWLGHLPKPVAILASCDLFACHLINIANEAKFNVPDEVAILGVNDDRALCNICDPPLSSVALNFKKAGYESAKLLDKIISGQQTMAGQCIEIQPTHIENRGSTDIFAIDDPEIIQVLKYIKQNSNKPLQVDEIASHVYISKRSLQLRFRKAMGRSIHDQIVQAHFDIAKALLIETNLPIDEIAGRSGFLYTYNMRRAFKQTTGMLPQKYRQQQRPE